MNNYNVQTLIIKNANIFAGTYWGGIFLSTDDGSNWTSVNSGLNSSYVQTIYSNSTNLFAGTYGNGAFLSNDNGENWIAINNGLTSNDIRSLVISGTYLFAGTGDGGIFLSTDNGNSWSAVNNGLTNLQVVTIAISGTNIFAGTFGGGIFLSTDTGANWSAVNSGLTNNLAFTLAADNGNVFAGTLGGGVFLSTDTGANWTAVNSGLTNLQVYTLFIDSTNIFAGTLGGGIFLSTDNGASWDTVNYGLTNLYGLSLAISGGNLFVGTWGESVWQRPLSQIIPVELISFTASVQENKVVLNWATATELNNQGFEVERQVGSGQSAVGNWKKIGYVTGFGTTTEPKSYSFTDDNISSGKYVYRLKQIDFDGTYEYSPEVEVEIATPKEFALEQNYPNPFNPSTKISWQSPVSGLQTLKVYDVLGNEVATLVNEYREAGSYDVEFNASNLSSGIYIYKIQAGDFVNSKKMILIK